MVKIKFSDVYGNVEKEPSDINVGLKGKEVPLPKKVSWFPKHTEFSGQFNDTNTEWRQKRMRFMTCKVVDQKREGAHAQGYYQHQKDTDDKIKIHVRLEKEVEKELENKDLETEAQRDQEGAEIRGYVELNKKKGKEAVRKMNLKVNKGINDRKGFFAFGNRYKQYLKAQLTYDNGYKQEQGEDEFSSLTLDKQELKDDKAKGIKNTVVY